MRAVDDLCAAAVCVQRVCDLWSVRTQKPAKKEIHTPGELQCPCKKKEKKRCAGCRRPATCSMFGWLVADGWYWFVLREEYCWLVVDG
jgi:hypothetical protein